MKLIKIDLNQTVSKAQLKEIKEEQKRWMIFSVVFLLFISSLSWSFISNYRLNEIISKRENKIEKIKHDTGALKAEGQINLSKEDINNLYKLQSKRIYWSNKFIEFSNITPEDMVITKLEYKGKKVNINGISILQEGEKPFKVVEHFMKLIEDNKEFNKDFKEIKFGHLEKEYSNKQPLVAFKIEARLK